MKKSIRKWSAPIVVLALSTFSVMGIEIVVDYTYDSNNFFDTQTKKDSLEAAAARFSRVISSSLDAVSPAGTGTGTSAGWRVGFTHPATGSSVQLSTATNFGSDPIAGAGAADVYGFGGLNANQWILYAGGRAMAPAGQGGTGTGVNFTSTFNDLNGPMHRGAIGNTPANTVNDLPAWGGSLAFDSGMTWHYGLNTVAGSGEVDLYSVALHEIGHALGLSLSFNQWQHDGAGNYTGANAVNAYNTDNGAALATLDLETASNLHWSDNAYTSYIFEPGSPSSAGTVGLGVDQDLLMDPIFHISASQKRLELTNVDVGALEDIGWQVIPEPSSIMLMAFSAAAFVWFRRSILM